MRSMRRWLFYPADEADSAPANYATCDACGARFADEFKECPAGDSERHMGGARVGQEWVCARCGDQWVPAIRACVNEDCDWEGIQSPMGRSAVHERRRGQGIGEARHRPPIGRSSTSRQESGSD